LLPEHSLTHEEVEAVARFSLGIPFVIAQTAAMWQEGKPLANIVAPVQSVLGETTPRQQVVKETCERFLMHCFSAKEREQDLRVIYALAMMRRPDVKLLREMLDVTDLEQELQSLRERYSFIWVEQIRLDEKLVQFLREYLLNPVRCDNPIIQQLNERAIAWLELQLEELTRDISDTAEQLQDERIIETIADLTYHHFWQGEEAGWRCLVPQAIVGSQYNRSLAQSLLEVAEVFSSTFSNDGQHRLKLLSKSLESFPEQEDIRQTLEEFEKLAQRKWLDGKRATEYRVILQLERGRLLYRQGKYHEALHVYLEVEKQIPECARQLRKNLAEAFRELGWKFVLNTEIAMAVPSLEAEIACSKAVALNEEDGHNLVALGVAQFGLKKYEKAVVSLTRGISLGIDPSYALTWLGHGYCCQANYTEALITYQKVIKLDPKLAYPHHGLGSVYYNQGKYPEAITAYQKALELNPKLAYSQMGLADVYHSQGKYLEAIAAYQKAIELAPNFALLYSRLGYTHYNQGNYAEALAAHQKAIELDPRLVSSHNGVGMVYHSQGKYLEAIAAYQKAIELNPNYSWAYNSLGWTYLLTGDLTQAKDNFEKAVNIDPKNYSPILYLGLVYALQGNVDEAKNQWQKGLAICQGSDGWSRFSRSLYTIAIGDTEKGITEMQKVLDEEGSAVGVLHDILEDAEILAQCSVKPAEIDTVVEMLKQAIG